MYTEDCITCQNCWQKQCLSGHMESTRSILLVSWHHYIHIFDSASKKFLALGLACTALAQPHTGTRIREALESALETWGLIDTNVLRYITDQGSNVINGLKTYQFHHTFVREELDCPETEESELDSESEESNIPETEPQVESDLSDTEEEDSDDVSNDSNDETNDRLESTTVDQSSFVESNQWLEHVYLPKRLSCIAHIFNSACRTVHDKKNSKVSKLKKKVYCFFSNGVLL